MLNKLQQWLSMSLVNNKRFTAFFEPLVQVFLLAYRMHGFRAKVMAIKDENSNVYSLVLKVSRRWKGFKAGQYIELNVTKDGVNTMRIFSISSCPSVFTCKRIIELTIQKQTNGRITPWLKNTLSPGQFISISESKGDFIVNSDDKQLLFIAAGTGITPIRSLLGDLKKSTDVCVMYYAKNNDHLFQSELKHLEKHTDNLTISFINSTKSGRISLSHLKTHASDFKNRSCFICGPSDMIRATEKLLIDSNVSQANIHYEYFGLKPTNKSLKQGGMVEFNQSNIKVKSPKTTQNTLLELAESAGLKPITGCRMGICHQCVCHKLQGIVYNIATQNYSDTGCETIQLCVSMPIGDVSINL